MYGRVQLCVCVCVCTTIIPCRRVPLLNAKTEFVSSKNWKSRAACPLSARQKSEREGEREGVRVGERRERA